MKGKAVDRPAGEGVDTATLAEVPEEERLDTDGDPFEDPTDDSHAVSPFEVENQIVEERVQAWYVEPGDVVEESFG